MSIQDDRVLTYKQVDDIRLECKLNLERLFRGPKERQVFDRNWPECINAHENNKDEFSCNSLVPFTK
jgi:hypothetical protein